MSLLASLRRRVDAAERRAAARSRDLTVYHDDPLGYVTDVLRLIPTPEQEAILLALTRPPHRVLVASGHSVGKTACAAMAVNWWYDSRDPGVVLTTAPTERDVVDLLWTEVRLQRQRANLPMHFIGPRSPEMRTGDERYAKGFTARKGESFQGRHRRKMLFVFDEANGVDPLYWVTTRTMFDPSEGHAWLAIFNPTDTSSAAYQEDLSCLGDDPPWHRFRLSVLDHPNVRAEVAGQPRPIPGAVSLAQVNDWVRDWCEPIAEADRRATDLEWPPGSGQWFRPGPVFQSRALGLWPEQGTGVWGEALWEACLAGGPQDIPANRPACLGVDTATGKGEDYCGFHGRIGHVSVLHETSNTMDAVRIAGRCRDMVAELARLSTGANEPKAAPVDPKKIPVQIDDDGTGNAVCAMLRREGYAVRPLGAGCAATQPHLYPNRRSEFWFLVAEKARKGLVHLGRLDRATLRRLRQQLTAPEWDLDLAGRRKVEPKERTKEKIGRSPDDADSMNLAYYEHAGAGGMQVVQAPERKR